MPNFSLSHICTKPFYSSFLFCLKNLTAFHFLRGWRITCLQYHISLILELVNHIFVECINMFWRPAASYHLRILSLCTPGFISLFLSFLGYVFLISFLEYPLIKFIVFFFLSIRVNGRQTSCVLVRLEISAFYSHI